MQTRNTRLLLFTLAGPIVGVGIAEAHAATIPDILVSADAGDDLGGRPVALALGVDGTFLLASESAGAGVLLRFDALGESAGPATPLSERPEDLAVAADSGAVVVVSDQSVRVFDRDLELRWQQRLPARGVTEPARRVAVGERGTVAVLAAGRVHVFTASGVALGVIGAGVGTTRGIAVSDGEGLVMTTGWRDIRACGGGLDVATLAGFGLDGAPRWQAYGELGEDELCSERGSLGDATRGVAVARGEDGYLYLLGEAEGPNNLFRTRPGAPGEAANNVELDALTDAETSKAALFAYYARFTAQGEHLRGQYLVFPEAGSIVQPLGIAADEHGNVYLSGTASHGPDAADEVPHSEALDAMAGFFTVVEPELEGRRLWQQFEVDGVATVVTGLALAGGYAATLVDASPSRAATGLHTGPTVLLWPGDHGPTGATKRPDRDSVGTFGYESGVSGSDPSCYCEADSSPTLLSLFALATIALALRRPRARPYRRTRERR